MGLAESIFIVATVLWVGLTYFVYKKIKSKKISAPSKTIKGMRDVE